MAQIIISHSSTAEKHYTDIARYYADKCNEIASVCKELGIKASENSVRQYVAGSNGIKAMKEAYIANELATSNNPTGRIANYVRSEASADFDNIIKAHGFTGKDKFAERINDYASNFVKFEKGAFVVDADKAREEATAYLKEADRPIYDLHLQICEMLTKFIGGSIENISQLDDYFTIEKGIVKPAFYGEYPPKPNTGVTDNA